MEQVEPIRDPRKVAAIKKMLRGQDHPRDYLLFVMGINTALRIGDLLSLKVGDVLDAHGEVVDYIHLREKKTGKAKRVTLNKSVKEALKFYFSRVSATDPEAPLFPSMRSGRPLDRTRVWRLINSWCRAVGLTQGRYGAHTLRKTWGYMARTRFGVPIELIQAKLGHSTPAVTRRYIGISADEIETLEGKVNL
ncbi:MAG: site-specific integrase [Chloroflexi bacterium]|nr:MAG: site-specific integrase [Chloroflexota bacterium]